MYADLIITFTLIAFTGYQCLAIYYNRRAANRFRLTRFKYITQMRFAQLRHSLIVLSMKREIAPESISFLNFYLIYTYVIRNPDQYEEIAQYLRENMIETRVHDTKEQNVEEALRKESKTWSRQVRELAFATGSYIEDLMIFNTTAIRYLHGLGKTVRGIARPVSNWQPIPRTGLIGYIANRSDVDRVFIEARDMLQDLAHTDNRKVVTLS